MYRSWEKGVSLLEVLVAFSILGIAFVGVTYFYQNAARSKQRIRLQAVQETLAHDIRSKLQVPSALYASLLDSKNDALIRCTIGIGSGCTEDMTTPPNTKSSRNKFTLHHPTGEFTSEAISSIYYSSIGKRNCSPNEATCIFTVDTFFYAVCPLGDDPTLGHPTTCVNGAQALYVGFSVSQVKAENGAPLLPALPRLVQFYALPIQDILGSARNASCNPGAVASGYLSTGVMSCTCKLPYVPSETYPPNRKGPICAQLSKASFACPAGLLYRGLSENGAPICKSFSEAYDCKTLSGADFTASQGSCGEGYWIQQYTRGTCNFYCVIGSAGGACNSWETTAGTDTRESSIYADKTVNTSGWSAQDVLQVGSMVKPGMGVVVGDAVEEWVREGMVCEGGSISCCKQK